MAHSPANPLYKKKPGESLSDHMKRLRREFPKKFGMQPGTKVHKKKFTAADLAAAEKRGAEKAKAELKISESPLIGPEVKASPVTEIHKPASEAASQGTGESVISKSPAPAPEIPAEPQIVSESDIFSPPPPPDQAAPENAGPPPPPPPQSPPTSEKTGDGGKYGAMIWAIIVKIFVSIFGNGFEPIIIKDSAGNVIYDESAEGTKVWVNYLASLGIKTFSPVVELWIFMSSYVGIRAGLVIQKFKNRKKAGAQPSSPPPAQEKKSPPETARTEPHRAAPQTPPEPQQPEPTLQPVPPPAIGEVETGEIEI